MGHILMRQDTGADNQSSSGAPRHNEQLADHARALADVLLHQLAAGHADEGAVRVVRHRARQQRLPRAWRAVQQHALLRSTNT